MTEISDAEAKAAARDGKACSIEILHRQHSDATVDLLHITSCVDHMTRTHGPVLGLTMLMAAMTEVTRDGLKILLGVDADIPDAVDSIADLPGTIFETRESLHHLGVMYAADGMDDHAAWTDYLAHIVREEDATPRETIIALVLAASFVYTHHLTRLGRITYVPPAPEPIDLEPDIGEPGGGGVEARPGVGARLASLLLRTRRHRVAPVRDRPA